MAMIENVALINNLNIVYFHWLKTMKMKCTFIAGNVIKEHLKAKSILNVVLSTGNITIFIHFVWADRTMIYCCFLKLSIGGLNLKVGSFGRSIQTTYSVAEVGDHIALHYIPYSI